MRYYALALLLVFFINFSGCQSHRVMHNDLGDIQKLSAHNVAVTSDIEAIRYDMLRDTALMYSSQMAFAKYAEKINQTLDDNQRVLNNSFNFQPLILESNVVPPVVLESAKTLESPHDNILVIADRTFEIYKDAYFQTAPVTWRNYLFINYHVPELPDKSLLPQNKVEQEVWSDFSQVGWSAGQAQAYATLNENLKQLKREYTGMVNYHRLLVQGILTSPIVNTQEHDIQRDGNIMKVNQRVYSIEIPSQFNTSSELWHSFIFFHEQS